MVSGVRLSDGAPTKQRTRTSVRVLCFVSLSVPRRTPQIRKDLILRAVSRGNGIDKRSARVSSDSPMEHQKHKTRANARVLCFLVFPPRDELLKSAYIYQNIKFIKTQVAAPNAVGTTADSHATFVLPVSFFTVSTVVVHGQWKRENIIKQIAVVDVQPFDLRSEPIKR